MEVKLNLVPSLIIETVQNETRFKAQFDRQADDKAIGVAYNEEAGDEAYHKRKLDRTLYAGIDAVKSDVIGFLDTATTGVNLTAELDLDKDTLIFTLVLNGRFNRSYMDPLAGLFSKYIEDFMLVQWWEPMNANMSQLYAANLVNDRQNINKCFIKDAPSQSKKSYGDVSGSTESYEISVAVDTSSSSGNGTVSGGGSYFKGTSVTLTATPDSTSRFDYWTLPDSTTSSDNPLTVTAGSTTAGIYKAVFSDNT